MTDDETYCEKADKGAKSLRAALQSADKKFLTSPSS